MEEILLTTQIKIFKELHNQDALEKIIIKMRPLVKKYVRKLYFMEKDDASQELNLSLIESVTKIKVYENEAMCLSYLEKSVFNKYCILCSQHIKFYQYCDEFQEVSDEVPYSENFKIIELCYDLEQLLENKNSNQKYIAKCLLNEVSDREIALRLGVSRQYVNRVKKEILKNYFCI